MKIKIFETKKDWYEQRIKVEKSLIVFIYIPTILQHNHTMYLYCTSQHKT